MENGDFLSLSYDYFATFIEKSILSLHQDQERNRGRGWKDGRERAGMIDGWSKEEEEEAVALYQVLEDLVSNEPLQTLCVRFLPYLSDESLFDLAQDVAAYHRSIRTTTHGEETEKEEKPLKLKLARLTIVWCRWKRLEDLLFVNALALFAGSIVKYLLSAGEGGEELGDSILAHLERQGVMLASQNEKVKDSRGHWALRRSLLSSSNTITVIDDGGRDRRRRREDDADEMEPRQQLMFICTEALLLHYRLALDFVDKRSLKKIMKSEGVAFQPVYVTTETVKMKKDRKGRKKPQKKTKKELIGWRFALTSAATSHQDTKELERKRKRKGNHPEIESSNAGGESTYAIADTPSFLVSLFMHNALRWLGLSDQV